MNGQMLEIIKELSEDGTVWLDGLKAIFHGEWLEARQAIKSLECEGTIKLIPGENKPQSIETTMMSFGGDTCYAVELA